MKKKLDDIFSKFIRQKDADENGYVKCFTCGKIDHWKYVHCGHYHSRRYLSLRWEEKNVACQCVACNRYEEGNKPMFTLALIRKYGQGILEELEIKKNNVCRMDKFKYQTLIDLYKQKLKEL